MTPDEIATDRVLVETLADFAANLRAEMYRRGIGSEDLICRLRTIAIAEAHAEGREGGDLSWCDALVHRAIGRDEGPALVKEDIIDLATALNCPVERLTVSREELERRLKDAEILSDDLVSHLEHERALRRQDREAANALRQSHDEIEVLLEVIEERFPETSAVINAVVAYDRANALRARVAELESQVQAVREWADCEHCWQDIEEIFGPRGDR